MPLRLYLLFSLMPTHPSCCSLSLAFCHAFHRFSSLRLASRHVSLPGSLGALLKLSLSRHDASFFVEGLDIATGTMDGEVVLVSGVALDEEFVSEDRLAISHVERSWLCLGRIVKWIHLLLSLCCAFCSLVARDVSRDDVRRS
jgi:hypothetical protein